MKTKKSKNQHKKGIFIRRIGYLMLETKLKTYLT